MTTLQDGGAMAGQTAAGKKIWVTLKGLPLTIRLEGAFHQSTSGADFWVLHGDIRLEGSEGLHAPVAVNLSQTVHEVMPSLEPKDAEAPVINALRKEVDRRQIEFLKSGKLLPVPFSSRHYDFKRQQWVFGKATDDVMAEFIERKVYWQTTLGGGKRVWLCGAPGGGDSSSTPRQGAGRECGLRIRRRRSICRRLRRMWWKLPRGWWRRKDCCGSRANGRSRRKAFWDKRRDSRTRGERLWKSWRRSTRSREGRHQRRPAVAKDGILCG